MEYYGNNDYRDYILAHHGILGMQWGKRNGPPYPIGSGGHSVSEKKAGWRKSLGGGRNEHLYDRKSESKPVDKPKKSGLQLTDKQKKALKIGAITAGVALAAVGTVYLARTGRLQQIGSAFMGGSSGPSIASSVDNTKFLKDAAAKGFKLKDHNPTGAARTVDYIKSELSLMNPTKVNNNCPAITFVHDIRARGLDIVAKPGPVLDPVKELVYPDYKKTPLGKKANIISAYNSFEKAALSMGEGARGEISIGFNKPAIAIWKKMGGKIDGQDMDLLDKFGHSYPFEIKDGKVLLLNGQSDPPRIYTRLEKGLQHLFWDKDSFSIARLDNLEVDPDFIGYIGKNRE